MEDETWYTREEATPSEKFGQRPEKREGKELLEKGLVLIDKPFGPTSNQVSGWIKEELDLKKTGHFGTLDPNATGVLPVGLNRGTRVQKALSGAEKEYVFEATITDEKNEAQLKEAVESFEGVNTQVPPEMSAVKKEEREREVYEAELLEAQENKLLAKIRCESGFYVRVMVEQLGEKLGTETEMTELRRTRQGGITEDELVTLQELVDGYHYHLEGKENLSEVVQPMERAVRHLRKVVIKDSAVNAVANGADLGATGISKLQDNIEPGERIAIMTLKGELVALATARMTSEEMFNSTETAATLETVHLDPETYPRRWKQE